MPKILVNYKYNKKTDTYTVLDNSVVYADMPVAIMDMHVDYEEILVVPINNQNTVVDKNEYLQKHKLFKLKLNEDGSVLEDAKGTPIWLPKDTDISKLKYLNGQLVLVSEENEGE